MVPLMSEESVAECGLGGASHFEAAKLESPLAEPGHAVGCSFEAPV